MPNYFTGILESQRNHTADALANVGSIKNYDLEKGIYRIKEDGVIIGKYNDLITALYLLENAKDKPSIMLILGETGTGKELVAKALHYNKTVFESQNSKPENNYEVVNCASIPSELIESELFGSKKGAYTGATDREGAFERADGGTIFLDEIGDMSLNLQTRLLRVIEDGVVQRVGATKSKKFDFRVIAATRRDLAQMVREGQFREDLYERIKAAPIYLTPLKERGEEDIKLLTYHFIETIAGTNNADELITPDSLDLICNLNLSGNIRNLKQIITNAETFSRGPITPDSITRAIKTINTMDSGYVRGGENTQGPYTIEVPDLREDTLQKNAIELALRETAGNKQQAAKLLGINTKTLYNRMDALGIADKKTV